MLHALRLFLLALVGVAIIGGTMPASAQAAPCGMAMSAVSVATAATQATAAAAPTPMAPCKTMTPGCIRLLGCVAVTALPARLSPYVVATRASLVQYWGTLTGLARQAPAPELLPPRSL